MVTRSKARWLLAGAVVLAAACRPELEGRPSLVKSERILAVRSVPADAKPQAKVRFDSLFVGPDGALDGEVLDWALCKKRASLTEAGSIASECLEREADELEQLGTGPGVDGSVIKESCEIFGPTPPTPKAGEPNARPADPDTTGGFYQSVRVLSGDGPSDYAVGVTRLGCGLGGATQEQSAEFTRRYLPNENPALDSLTLTRDEEDEQVLPDVQSDELLTVNAGETVTLRASWADCGGSGECGDGVCVDAEDEDAESCPEDCQTPHGCSGAEPYVYFDPLNRSLTDRREAMRVSWFATAGRFEHERTGRAEDEASELSTDNTWTAPDESMELRLWVVLRDDRGGVGWGSYRLQVD